MFRENILELEKKIKKEMECSNKKIISKINLLKIGIPHPNLIGSLSIISKNKNISKLKIQDVSTLTSPNIGLIKVHVWDKLIISDIKKTIEKSNLGVNPFLSNSIIQCIFPKFSREKKINLLKIIKLLIEEGKIKIRSIRNNFIKKFKKEVKKKTKTQDELISFRKNIQIIYDYSIKKLVVFFKEKEKKINLL
jgi:ribosome recycling factor